MAEFHLLILFTVTTILLLKNEFTLAATGPGLQIPKENFFFEDTDIVISNNRPRYELDHDYRLPEGLIPERYVVHLRPILEPVAGEDWVENTCPGSVKMFVQATQDMNVLTFNSNQIDIDFASILIRNENDGTLHQIATTSSNPDFQIVTLTLELDQELKSGQKYLISLKFTAKIPRSLLGMYYRTYMSPEGVLKKIVLTKLEAVGARMVFPCFDEPALKATYQINIAHTVSHTTLCNMRLASRTIDPDFPKWTWDGYEETVKMSTYLIAFVVSEFNGVEAVSGIYNKPVSTWAAPHHIANGGGQYSADETARMLKYFTDLYDLDYPLPKMYSAAIPEFSSGAMEQWGLITYRDDYFLYFPGVSTESDRWQISRITAHEVAHQWFGNIVTLEWWDNLWLNEGFARHIEKVGVDHTQPEFEANLFAVSTARINAMNADASVTTKPVHHNGDNLSGIVYDKASFLIRMMEGFLSKATVQKALNRYLKKHLYGNVRQDSLFEELTIAGHEDGTLDTSMTVKAIMDTWTHQTGFPLVRVCRIETNGAYHLSMAQERFGKTPPIINLPILNPDNLWTVPLSLASTSNPDFTPIRQRPLGWLDKTENSTTVPLSTGENEWVILNVDASAYFRVIYDEHLTKTLQDQLNSDAKVISRATISQIIDDHFKSAFEGYVPIETALDFTKFLNQENTLVVWQTFFSNFRSSFVLFNGHSKHASEFKEYISDKLTGGLNNIGVKQLSEHKGANVLARVQLLDWACSLGLDVCTDYAKDLFQEWTTTPDANPVPVDIRTTMYCAIVWSGGRAAFDFMLSRYENETVKLWPYNVKPVFRNALSCAAEDVIIDELLGMTITEDSIIDKADRIEILVRLAASSEGRPKLTDFLQTNLNDIVLVHGVSAVGRLVTAQVAHWSENDKINQLRNFIESNPVLLEPILPTLDRAITTIETNVKWMTDFGNAMGDWFIVENDRDEASTLTPLPSENPSTLGPDPSGSPSTLEPEPSVNPSTLGTEPSENPSTVGPQPSESPSTFEPEPSENPSTFGPEPSESPSTLEPEPSVNPSTLGPEPSGNPSTVGPQPSESPSTFEPEPSENPSTFGPEPSESPSTFEPEPSENPSTLGPEPSGNPSTVGPQPSESPSTFEPEPSENPSTFGPEPSESPSTLEPEPSVNPSTLGTEPSENPSTVGPQPSESPSTFEPEPSENPSTFGPEPSESPSTLEPEPSVNPSTLGPEPSGNPSTVGPQPSESPSTFEPEPSENPSTFGPEPSESPSTFEPEPSENPSTLGPEPSGNPSTVGPQPSESPSTFEPEPSENPSTFGPEPSESPSTLEPEPSVNPSTLGPEPSGNPSTVGPQPSESPSTFEPEPSENPSTFGPEPSENPSTLGPQPSENPSTLEPGPSQNPSTMDTEPSEIPPTGNTEPSKIPTSYTEPSEIPTTVDHEPSETPTTVDSESSEKPSSISPEPSDTPSSKNPETSEPNITDDPNPSAGMKLSISIFALLLPIFINF